MTTHVLPRLDDFENVAQERGIGSLSSSVGNLPLKQLAYQTRIVGFVRETTITQTYYNPFDECIEATYIFPIESEQAVTGCEMFVNGRIIRARLKERQQARQEYQRAMAAGHRAALLEENRPETFSMKVGNIPPGEAVLVRIQTVGRLDVVGDEWTLRLPLVVPPRYTSGLAIERNPFGDGVSFDTDQVPDASTVTPPTWLPNMPNPIALRIDVDVDLGELAPSEDWPQQIRSSLHSVLLERKQTDSGRQVAAIQALLGEKVNRDFILRGHLRTSRLSTSLRVAPAPRPTEDVETSRGTFSLDTVAPKAQTNFPRDVVFVLDRSGSMNGWKMQAARRGVCRLIDTLNSEDRFEVLAFDNRIDAVSKHLPMRQRHRKSRWITATDANRFEATRWLSDINARGGTEMATALLEAMNVIRGDDFSDQSKQDTPRNRAIVLITDGQITGEDAVLQALSTIPEHRRPQLYALGIDRSVNGGVLKRLTKFAGGSFDLVESEQRLDEVMQRFAREIGCPALRNFTIEPINGNSGDLTLAPGNQRTLYSSRVCSIYGRDNTNEDVALRLSGLKSDGSRWSEEVQIPTDEFDQNSSSAYLAMWGRQRVRELEDQYVTSSAGNELRERIIQCSLESNVLSRFTAYVAVDDSEVVNDGSRPHQIVQPVELPEGWSLAPIPTKRLISLSIPVLSSSFALNTWNDPHDFRERVLRKKVVTKEQYSDAQNRAADTETSVGMKLIALGYLTHDQFAKIIAESHSLPYVDAKNVVIPEDVIELIPESVARENMVCPFASGDALLSVLISDPTDFETLDKLQFILNRNIQPVIATPDQIAAAINAHYGEAETTSVDSMLQEFTETAIDFSECDRSDDVQFGAAPASRALPDDPSFSEVLPRTKLITSSEITKTRRRSSQEREQSPIVRLVNLILKEAISLRATHIFIRPMGDGVRIDYVIDGEDIDRDHPPRRLLDAMVTRLKILSQVDLSASEDFQSGQFAFTDQGKSHQLVVHFASGSDGSEVMIEVKSSNGTPSDSAAKWLQKHASEVA